MSRWSTVLTVAWFEFLRVFRFKDLVVSLLVFCSGGLFFAWLASSGDPVAVPVTVMGDALELEDADHLPFAFLDSVGSSEQELRARVASGESGPVLLVRDIDDVEVVFADQPPAWLPQLQAVVRSAQRVARLKASGLSGDALDAVLQQGGVAVTVHDAEAAERKAKQQWLAFLCIGVMMLGIFMGNAHLFTGITGEKQSRVTESVMSAISPQTWIDGKLLGLCGIAVYGLLVVMVCWAVANQVYGLFEDPVRIPVEIVEVGTFVWFLVLCALGFAMWFAFFGAIASTIDDPNTSSRSMFMFVPMAPLGVAFLGMDQPDALSYRIASMFPLSAPTAMPVRMVMGDPAWWELVVAVALLVATTWLFRTLAGRIFKMGMLTHGTEPSWRAMWRALWAD